MKMVIATAVAAIVAACATMAAAQSTPVWFPMTTTNGCIFYRDAYPELIDELKSKIKKTVWAGPPCKPGEPINAVGTLEQTLSDGGSTWTTKSTGPYVDGVRHGLFEFSTSTNPQPRTRMFDRGCDATPNCVKRPIAAVAAAPPLARPAPPRPTAQAPATSGSATSGLAGGARDVGDHSRCLEPHHPDGGSSSFFQNTCGYKVWFYYCVYGAQRDASADCQKARGPGFDGVGAYTRQAAPIHGGTQVYWLACRDPAQPTNVVFELGRGLVGRCQ